MADIWAETLILPCSAICADSNFFGLGGDSILSLQVAWRLGANGWPVSLKLTCSPIRRSDPWRRRFRRHRGRERAKVDDGQGDGAR